MRWNALEMLNLPPAIVQPGATYWLTVHAQNTGVDPWNTTYSLSYKLCQGSVCANEDGAYNMDDPPGRVHVCILAEDYRLNLGFFGFDVTMFASSVSRYEGTLP